MCTACTTNNKNVPEVDVTVEETETVETDEMVETDTEWIIPEETEVVEPEVIEEETIEAIDIVENTEEKPVGKKLNVHDAQKFLESNNAFETVKVSAKSTESEVEVTPAVETEVVEVSDIDEAHNSSESSLTSAGHYDAAKDIAKDNFASYPISCTDLASNPTLVSLQAEVNPIIDNDGGCNEGFILRSNEAVISYVGESYFVDAKILVDGNLQTTLSINCNLNDISWKCISTTLEAIYPNLGAALASEIRKDCEVGSGIYGDFNEWTTYNGVHTKVILAEGGDSLVYVIR